jgi:hypothetical protein
MPKLLSTSQIEATCQRLLNRQRRVNVREVMRELRKEYGASGRTERVVKILRAEEQRTPAILGSVDASPSEESLREQLSIAEQRAARSEALERDHQDFWAARYEEKVSELTKRTAPPSSGTVPSEQYLRLFQRATELARRLSKYEAVEPLLPPMGASRPLNSLLYHRERLT